MGNGAIKSSPRALLALLLAWLAPGAGHVYLGRRARGIIIFLTIGATFWIGVAMGGVMTVDSRNEQWWFVADMFAGVHGLVSWQRQEQVWNRLLGEADAAERAGWGDPAGQQALMDKRLSEAGLALVAPTDTVARAFAGVAGLLNLMCIFDAVLLALMRVGGEAPPKGPPARRQQQ
jgi:TM2 domain-containing membrane protein YozV